jgi:glutaredoxin
MKNIIFMMLLIVAIHFAGRAVQAADSETSESECPLDTGKRLGTSGACGAPDDIYTTTLPEGSLLLLLRLQQSRAAGKDTPQTSGCQADRSKDPTGKIIVYFFWGRGCPHCEREMRFLRELKRSQPSLEIRDYEVWHYQENAALLARLLRAHGVPSSGVPVTFVHNRLFSGFTAGIRLQIEQAIEECSRFSCGDPAELLAGTDRSGPPKASFPGSKGVAGESVRETTVSIPFLENLDARNASLPMITLVIAGMDSFNPCAFFVLLSLLGLLVHARSRGKMLLIGGIFVFFSGLIYFLFMAAWLNLYIVMGQVTAITAFAGAVSLVIAAVNIKDFFLFKQGLSLTIPEHAKPKLFERMRRLLHSTSLVSLVAGTTVLAVVANAYELLCTAGFPMVYTRLLTLNDLSAAAYYLYLTLYNLVYVVPLFLIVLGFSFTLGKRQLTEWQGRVLKLMSGSMMLGLGSVLLFDPALLNSVSAASLILASALGVSLLTAAIARKTGC